ncbi:LD-carboxypeptidase [Rossellomorea aquimaris]|uniref:S66 family peptidase n=1 Tax=Rossellomorea aquimaris TaxID=189382 RepID=UPI001CD2C9EF|nr:S66 peptidase family protein [Rossellomorea aquimaris]MCA1054464.1 LD-carboxypeptidase [Rossellomorea aquimaris]
MNIPAKLQKGDTIGICSPSSPVAAYCPRRLKRGIEELKHLGFKVKVGEHTRRAMEYMAGSIDDRVADLHELFKDPEVKAIITTIGGTCSHQLLEKLDYGLIREHPKIFMGYSDITALHTAIYTKTGMTTYLGPAILPQFGEYGGILPYTKEYFLKTLVEGEKIEYQHSDHMIMEHLWWDEEDDRPRQGITNGGPSIINEGSAEGRVFAGNVGTLLLLAGTDYFPDLEGSILFIEDDPEETPSSIDRYLTQLRHLGVYSKISGLVIGRFHENVGFKEDQLSSMVKRVTEGYTFPIVTDLDFGHTDPMFILPNGIRCRLRAGTDGVHLRLLEHPVT